MVICFNSFALFNNLAADLMELIRAFITEYADLAVISKGEAVHAQQRVFKLVDKSNNLTVSFNARVQGNGGVYECRLELRKGDHVDYYCSCPYNWGGPCKHIVAAALTFETQHDKPQQKEIDKTEIKPKASPIQVDVTNGIELSTFGNLPFYHSAMQSWSSLCQLYGWREDAVEVKVFDNHSRHLPLLVTFRLSQDFKTLEITSKPSSTETKEMRLEEFKALVFIVKSGHFNFLLFKNPEHRENAITTYAQKFGVEDFKLSREIFHYDEEDFNHPIKINPQYGGMLPISEKGLDLSALVVPKPASEKEESLLAIQKKEAKDDRQLLFCLEKQPYGNDLGVLSITPFVSRLKSNGDFYKTGFKEYQDLSKNDEFDATKEQSNIIELCLKTHPFQFSTQYNGRIRKIASKDASEHFVLQENLKQLEEVLAEIQQISGRLYYIDHQLERAQFQPEDLIKVDSLYLKSEMYLEVTCEDQMICLAPHIKSIEDSVDVPLAALQSLHPLLYVIEGATYLLKKISDAELLQQTFSQHGQLMVHESQFNPFFDQVIQPIANQYSVTIDELPKEVGMKKHDLQFMSKSIYLKELDNFILLIPRVEYDELDVDILDSHTNPMVKIGNDINTYIRDFEAEKNFMEEVKGLHKKFAHGTNQSFLSLSFDEFIQDYWFLKLTEKAKALNIEVYGFDEFKKFQYAPQVPNIQVTGSSEQDWFDLEILITVGDEKVSLKEVKRAILAKEKFVKLGNGKLAVLPEEWLTRLEKYLRVGKVDKDNIQISKLRFNVLDELFEEINAPELVLEIAEKKQKLLQYKNIQDKVLPEVNADLRDYQVDGYNWLHFLHEFGWGGILADDMGLGKTIQMITFLKSLVDMGISNHLVVVPTSLLFNWEHEINKFCPSLKYHIYYGSDREKNPDWSDYDLIITTYGLMVSEASQLSQREFGYIILDESQAIKNPTSKRYKAAMILKAKNRIVMTGTPIENNTFDLYAQMSFVNPGLFINAESFKKNYSLPIDKYGNHQVASELSKMISPFMLRRTKEHVAKELPEKTEDVIYCEMDKAQRKVYDSYRNEYRNEILGLIENNGMQPSSLHVLQALMKLRQICNSPALLNEEESKGNDSVKIKELIRHIEEKTGNHKMLIFSQFVGMLGLIRKELDKLEITHSYLDGKTSQKKRKEAVDQFQNDEETRVFLISLKAGGTGLNLTAADYVYIVDPWWNPAVENQAIDRCYRIGQDKKVIAYRMICVDTLEEKIMKLKERKQTVADSIIHTDENISKQISKDDLMYLLS
jgi:SNF2 family DNA or RNA helicase